MPEQQPFLEASFLITFGVLGCTCSLIWVKLFRKFKQGVALLPPRLRDPHPIGMLDVILVFFTWILAQQVALAVLGAPDLAKMNLEARSMAIATLGITQLLFTVACLVLFRFRYKSCSSFGGMRKTIGKDLWIGLIAFFVIIPPVLSLQMVLTSLVEYRHDTLESLKEATSIVPIATAWFGAVLVAPFVEEVFFRGVLQNWLQRIGNTHPEDFGKLIAGGWFTADETMKTETTPVQNSDLTATEEEVKRTATGSDGSQVYFDSKLRWSPIFISAGLFAAAHIGQGAAPIPLFFLGVGLGYLFRQTGSILPCIVVHFLLNFHSMFWATMAVVFNPGQ